jgi:probable phosphoglycerate mutase
MGIPYVIDSRIRESGLGDYNNRNISEVGKMSRTEMGMESWDSHINRFREIFGAYEGTYVMVSHALPIRAAISSFLGFNEEESFGINIRNASMSVIDIEKKRVLSIGSFLVTPKIHLAFRS